MNSFAQQISPGAGSNGEDRWYACYTRARHEKQVDRLLQRNHVESYLPIAMRRRQWKDRETVVAFPLFPSYVFARFSLERLYTVVSTPGIATIVRRNGEPVPIRDAELENVRRFVAALSGIPAEAEVIPLPEKGDHVTITSGPFEGIRGIVAEHRGRHRILVGLQEIGWGVQIEVDAAAIAIG
jgi:transcription antitermination factor NusG